MSSKEEQHEELALKNTKLRFNNRPDNWVIFNKTNEEPPLPQPPAVSTGMGAEPTAEVPMPFYSVRRKQNIRVAEAMEATPKKPEKETVAP